MKLVIFPFETERIDNVQGAFSRAVPELLRRALVASGIPTELELELAERGAVVAHVLYETLPPATELDERAREHGSTHRLTGRSLITTGRCELDLAIVSTTRDEEATPRATPSWTHEVRCASRDLNAALRDLLEAIVGWAETEAGGGPGNERHAGETDWQRFLPERFDALRNLVGHVDNVLLRRLAAEQKPPGAPDLADPQDAWRHAVAALEAEPASEAVVHALEETIEALRSGGDTEHAARAAFALAEHGPGRRTHWEQASTLARAYGDDELLERALAALAPLSPEPAEAWLELGVLKLRGRRSDEACDALDEAAKDERIRDTARAYRAIAMAARGEVAEAVQIWTELVRESDDERAVEIAKENLRRARPQ